MLQTSGTCLILSRTLIGYAFFMNMMKQWPHPKSSAYFDARFFSLSSFPSYLTKHGPELSQKPMPNLISGAELTNAS